MSDLILPAPIWRRLAALVYDGLLYVALLMAGLVLATPLVAFWVAKDATTPLHNFAVLQVYGYVIGLLFFGWSWARGGQTLGMRVWRLQVRRLDGSGLRWPIAALRFTAWSAGTPCVDRPDFTATMGFVRDTRLAMRENLRGLPIDSR